MRRSGIIQPTETAEGANSNFDLPQLRDVAKIQRQQLMESPGAQFLFAPNASLHSLPSLHEFTNVYIDFQQHFNFFLLTPEVFSKSHSELFSTVARCDRVFRNRSVSVVREGGRVILGLLGDVADEWCLAPRELVPASEASRGSFCSPDLRQTHKFSIISPRF